MNRAAAQALIDLNREFYQTFALQFSGTRQSLQPGVRRILANISLQGDILDLGCGNGRVWLALQQAGFTACYIGIDSSPVLLSIARQAAEHAGSSVINPDFIEADLSGKDWAEDIRAVRDPDFDLLFQTVFAFAMLHHLPGFELRLALLHQIKTMLLPGGYFIHSEWQFQNSPRLMKRIQPWSAVGLDPEQLEPGDYLLDWRQGGKGLRYVHLFSPQELTDLAGQAGFTIQESFYSDGKSGNLAIYQFWQASETII